MKQLNDLVQIKEIRNHLFSKPEELWVNSIDHDLFLGLEHGLNVRVFEKVYFLEILFNVRVDWGAPHPGFFYDMFPALLQSLTQSNRFLFFVHDSSEQPSLMQQAELYLSDRKREFIRDKERNWIAFEVEADDLAPIRDIFFEDSLVSIGGCVDPKVDLREFAEVVQKKLREDDLNLLISKSALVFRVLFDGNGLFIITDKIDGGILKESLLNSESLRKKVESLDWSLY